MTPRQEAVDTRRGRGTQRRALIIKAATEVFLEQGYERARLEEVIHRSGGSLATLYAKFGGKEGLFGAIIAEICAEMVAGLPALDEPPSASPRDVLVAFARTYLRLLLTPVSLGLYRVVMGESGRFPELGRAVFEAGPAVATARLAEYLRHQSGIGALSVGAPDLAARHFLEMVKGDLHFRALLGSGLPPSAEEIDLCVRVATDTFLEGVASQSARGPAHPDRGNAGPEEGA